MECDPRLRQARLEQVERKQQQALQRQAAVERAQQAKLDQALAHEQAQVELQKQRLVDKERREQEKKLLRKARQHLRRITSSAYTHLSAALASPTTTSCYMSSDDVEETITLVWPDSYDMGVDVDVLCSNLDLEQLKELTITFEAMTNHNHHSDDNVAHQSRALRMIQQRAIQERNLAAVAATANSKTAVSDDDDNDDDADDRTDTTGPKSNGNNSSNEPWTKEELSTLAKGVKKYPPGGSSRWDQITLYMSNICKKSRPRTKEECIAKYNEVARNNSSNASAGTAVAESMTNGNKLSATIPSAADLSSAKAASMSNGNKSAKAAVAPPPARAAAAVTTTTAQSADSNTDCWTAEQDEQLQAALSKFPVSMDKNERWTAIAAAVTDKTKKQCVQRFKVIREALQKKK
jgi:DnaJ homolog subfamily C member 2